MRVLGILLPADEGLVESVLVVATGNAAGVAAKKASIDGSLNQTVVGTFPRSVKESLVMADTVLNVSLGFFVWETC